MNKFTRWLRQLILSFICLLFLAGCSLNTSYTAPKMLIIATEPAFPPFEFQSKSGELQGFDIDLMNAIAQASGFKVKFQSLPFDGIIPALQAKTVDGAISGITITQERAKTISFSRPYFKAGLAIAIRANETKIANIDDLKNKKVAVQIGTTGAKAAQNIPGVQLRTFDSAPLSLQELSNGNVDAVINDAPGTIYAVNTGNVKSVKIISQLLTEEYYCIVTTKNSPALDAIDKGLTKILDNGIYDKIYQKWFNGEPPQLPETATVDATKASISSTSAIVYFLPTLLKGALVTLQLTIFSVFFGGIGGCLIGIARLSSSQLICWISRAYVDFFRGTPLLVQIFMIYFGLPALLQDFSFTFSFNRFAAAVVALSLNSAAYIAEIVRAGIQSIDKGQAEAAKSLGMNSIQTMRLIVFPQALRRMLPPLGNEFISLLKDTSLVAVIGFEELFRRGQLIVADNYRAFEIYTAVALIYLGLTIVSSQVFSFLERSMNPIYSKNIEEN